MGDEVLLAVRNLAVTGAILAALYVAATRLRRFLRSTGRGRLELLESIALGQRAAIHLVRIDDRVVAVGVGTDVRFLGDSGSAAKKRPDSTRRELPNA